MSKALRAAAQRAKERRELVTKAVSETWCSTRDTFERNRIVFTIGGTLLSAGAAWAGFAARKVHQSNLEERLQAIQRRLEQNHGVHMKDQPLEVNYAGVSYTMTAYAATVGLLAGFGMGYYKGRLSALRRLAVHRPTPTPVASTASRPTASTPAAS
eukprot:jgi/Chlat1/9152/Chrsp97S08443